MKPVIDAGIDPLGLRLVLSEGSPFEHSVVLEGGYATLPEYRFPTTDTVWVALEHPDDPDTAFWLIEAVDADLIEKGAPVQLWVNGALWAEGNVVRY